MFQTTLVYQDSSPLKKYGAKVAGGIACSAFVAFVMHLSVVKAVILWACQIILIVFGRPPGAQKLDTLEQKVVHAVEKGKQIAKERDHPAEAVLQKALGTVVAPVREAVAVTKAVEEVAKKAEAVKETAAQGAKAVEKVGEKVVVALNDAGGRAKDAVGGMGASITGFAQARVEAKEKADREKLEAHAAVIGFKTDPGWTFPRLQAEVLQAELTWQAKHGPNSKCPNPRCRYTARINTKRRENRRCPLCGMFFTTNAALAAWKATHAQNIHIFGR